MTRKEAIKQLRLLKGDITFGIASKVENNNQIEALSIAIASLETDEAYQLEYERTAKNVDCVSRADAIGSIAVECSAEKLDIDYEKFLMLRRAIKALPTVTPIRPKGHWIEQIDHEENCRTLICSNCDRPALHDGDSIWKHKFCPHCGADMREVEE